MRHCLPLLVLAAAPLHAQQRFIEPDPRTGASAAVVVSGDAPLLHTPQLFASGDPKDAPAQVAGLLKKVRAAVSNNGASVERIVKLNFYLVEDGLKPVVRKQLAKMFPQNPPAVSYVSGKLAEKDALVAVDVVATLPRGEASKLEPGFRVLPPGARVYISGQAEKGADLAEATRKTLESLDESLKFLKLSRKDVIQYKSFLNPMAESDKVLKELARFHGDEPAPPMILVEWKSSLPIEIELIARAGRDREGVALEFLTPPALKASPVYSRIARVNSGNLIYISSLYGDPSKGHEAEVVDMFDRLGRVLKKADSDLEHLAKATYYVAAADVVKVMGQVRPRYYNPKRPPAASLAVVPGVAKPGQHVSLDMIAVPSPGMNINDYGPAEHGADLTPQKALAGWLSLFDHRTTFGWDNASVEKGVLKGGKTTSVFGPVKLGLIADRPGTLIAGGQKHVVRSSGPFVLSSTDRPGAIELADGLAVRTLIVQPLGLESLWNGKDLTHWKQLEHPRRAKEIEVAWHVKNGLLHAEGGPGALEYEPRLFGDMILQVELRTCRRLANGGLFFRAIPGDFMNGYEAQVYNRCLENDPAKPATWATGGIDDRQNARRLISRDGDFYLETVLAVGAHIATWVNGYQVVDWTDTRPAHANPRQGLRLEAGAIQLQAHDPGTSLEFRRIVAAAIKLD